MLNDQEELKLIKILSSLPGYIRKKYEESEKLSQKSIDYLIKKAEIKGMYELMDHINDLLVDEFEIEEEKQV